ncbi:MAG: polysaccharide deacetylase family protein [Verrucomicrobiae bacterium]|nr:polysaccharide deacetylase family protein [Verrucomicrobiae bacterium]
MGGGVISRGAFIRAGALAAGGLLLGGRGLARAQAGAGVPQRGDSLDSLVLDGSDIVGSPFLMRGARNTKRVALTFDDGPSPGVTNRVLETLRKYKVRATFFMIGQRVVESPGLAKEVQAAGHELANHSFTHPTLGSLSADRVASELHLCQDAIEKHVGVRPSWLRPPYGSFKTSQGPIARSERLGVVIWSVDPRDWARPGVAAIQQRVLGGTAGGDIILCHDLHSQTADAAPGMIEGLLERGFQPGTLSDLVLG